MTPRVTGLDLSLTSTGIAEHQNWTRTIKPGKRRGAERLYFIAGHVRGACIGSDLVVIEGYANFGRAHGDVPNRLGELGGVIRCALWEEHVHYIEVPPATLKKYATGKGNANKAAMLAAAAERFGYGGESDDEADALFLRAYGLDHYTEIKGAQSE